MAPAPASLDPTRASETRTYQLTTTLIVCPIFAGVLVALRLYTRLTIIRKRFWEDASIAIALTFSIVMSLFNQLAVMYGSGRHFETISPPEFVEFLKVGIVVTQVYSLAHFFLKLSILLQYVRVSVTPIDRRLCQGLIVVLCLGYATFIVMRMVRCIPIQAQWTPNLPGGKCFFNSTWFMFASQVWNMVMDFVMLLVPLLVLRHSRAPLLHRVLIGVVLAFGSSACIISILRLHTLHPSTTSSDPSWDKVPSAIFGIIEVNVGIACAAVVTLRPLFRVVQDRTKRDADPSTEAAGAIRFGNFPGRRHMMISDDGLGLVTFGSDTTRVASACQCGHIESGVDVGRCRHHGNSKSSFADTKTVGPRQLERGNSMLVQFRYTEKIQ